VAVSVKDTEKGIPEEILDKIIEPLLTPKKCAKAQG
jgi:signal transduction histidine kinase